jgi:hypothetical protein
MGVTRKLNRPELEKEPSAPERPEKGGSGRAA